MPKNRYPIYILDDDKYPDGRATRVKENLEEKGYEITLFKTFLSGLKKAFDEGKINKKGLFVLDSTIEEEGRPTVDFTKTIRFLTDQNGVSPENLMPASGGTNGHLNNEYFETLLNISYGYVSVREQMGLKHAGMSGETGYVASKIEDYYKKLYPEGIGEGTGEMLQ